MVQVRRRVRYINSVRINGDVTLQMNGHYGYGRIVSILRKAQNSEKKKKKITVKVSLTLISELLLFLRTLLYVINIKVFCPKYHDI